MSAHVVVNEIYASLQGESTFAGLPCVFVRLTGCHLRCSYCDTAYAFGGGRRWPLAEVVARVRELAGKFRPGPRPALVEVTGGEPLLQRNALPLMQRLCDAGYTVLLETGGALDIAPVDSRVHRIVDLKCPGSGESGRNRWANLGCLRATDEIKFVIAGREDYAWAKAVLEERRLARICPVLFSWAAPLGPRQQDPRLKPRPVGLTPISRSELAEQIVADGLPVRFQLQMHKFIWPADRRGV